MPTKTVNYRDPDNKDIINAAARIFAIPGMTISTLIEAALRAAKGETIAEIKDEYAIDQTGDSVFARVDEKLTENVTNISREIRIGFAMITLGFSREQAEQWEKDRGIRPGRPKITKKEITDRQLYPPQFNKDKSTG